MSSRSAEVVRNTAETQVRVRIDLDGTGRQTLASGVPFLDHMLDQIARHGLVDLEVSAKGDLHIDGHHTTEDVGIALGQALRQALGDRIGIERFGHMAVPLDEALVTATLDISGRGYLVYELKPPAGLIGTWDTELVREFFGGFTENAKCCLHLHQLQGRNSHHIVEAGFKAFARVVRQAVRVTGTDVPSTKGVLA